MIKRILFSLCATLLLANGARAQNRQFPLKTIQNQCIDFQDLKRGNESWEIRDCQVSDFGEFGTVAGKVYYYATYCIIPNGSDPGTCGDTSFTARYHQSRGLAVFEFARATNQASLLFERVNPDIGIMVYSDKPAIIRNQFGTLLYLPIRVDGTGNMNASEYYVRQNGKWERLDSESWLSDLTRRIPRGLELWKGVWPDLHTMRAEAAFYRRNDAGCCPSGGIARIRLSIRAKKFILQSVVVDTTTLIRAP